jgi:hypothetical protein
VVQLIKWTGLALEITGKALAQSDIEDALLELVREGADRWFGQHEEVADQAETKRHSRKQVETLVREIKSRAFRLALADAVTGVAPVIAAMLARRTRPDRLSFVPERIMAAAIRRYISYRLKGSAEIIPLKENESDVLLYNLLMGDSLRALRIAAQRLPVRDGWFRLRKRWGYHLGSAGDNRVFLIGYDETFDWGMDKGIFFTFQQKGGVPQVEEYINKQHQTLRDDVTQASIALAQKSQAARTSIMLSFYPGVESIYSEGYDTGKYFEKSPEDEVYSDTERIRFL